MSSDVKIAILDKFGGEHLAKQQTFEMHSNRGLAKERFHASTESFSRLWSFSQVIEKFVVLNKTRRKSYFCVVFFRDLLYLACCRWCLFMQKDFRVCLNKGGGGLQVFTNKARQNSWQTAIASRTISLQGKHKHILPRPRSIQEAVHRSHDLDDHRHSLVYRSVRSPVGLRGVVDAGADVLRRSGHTLGTSPWG